MPIIARDTMVRATIDTRFNERKTAAAAGILLKHAGGHMAYLNLIKLLYLADRESWHRFNRPITGDSYVSMKLGPVLSRTLNLIKDEVESEGPWKATISRHSQHEVELDGDPDMSALSDAEIEILEDTFNLHRYLDQWSLCEWTHRMLPEWKDPKDSALPIQPEDILRALRKSHEEIDEARQDALEVSQFEDIFGK